jgi:starvation-inducible DNA-binding protein
MQSEKNDARGFITELLGDHEAIIITLQENTKHFLEVLKEAISSDFITGIMENHKKWLEFYVRFCKTN